MNTLILSCQKKLQLHTLKKEYLATKLREWKEIGCVFYIPWEALDSTGIAVTLEEIKSILKLEMSTNKDHSNFTTSGVNISNELQLFLTSPMTYYNTDTTDLFLFTFGNFFDINTAIFKSNERECWAEDLMKNNGCNKETIHFVKTLSWHIDLAVLMPTKDTSLDDSAETTKKVMTRYNKLNHAARVSKAEKQIKRMILVLNVSCFHVFFLRYKIIFSGIHFYHEYWQEPLFSEILIKRLSFCFKRI